MPRPKRHPGRGTGPKPMWAKTPRTTTLMSVSSLFDGAVCGIIEGQMGLPPAWIVIAAEKADLRGYRVHGQEWRNDLIG